MTADLAATIDAAWETRDGLGPQTRGAQREAVCSARNVTALPNSPPTEKPCNNRAMRIRIGAASPIVA